MNCPKCGTEAENGVCNTCRKNIKEIYLQLFNEAQGKRDYDTALYYIEDIKKLAESEDELKEFEELSNQFEFMKYNEMESGKRAVKLKNNGKFGRKTKREKIKIAIISSIILAVILIISLASFYSYKLVLKNSNTIIDGKKFKTAVLIDFSLKEEEFENKEKREFYLEILNKIRAHKDVKIYLEVSGFFIENMNKYDNKMQMIIKEGVADGQITITGTTYSESVIEANSTEQNIIQLAEDLKIKKTAFGVVPAVFYNQQGIWGKESINLINRKKYSITFIDDSKLEKVQSGYSFGKIGVFENSEVKVIPFIKSAQKELDKIIYLQTFDKKAEKEFYKIIREIYLKNPDGTGAIYIYPDAENNSYEKLKNYITNFDKLLFSLENKEWIQTVNKEKDINTENLYKVKNVLGNSAAEIENINCEGYSNWYDLIRESKKSEFYKKEYEKEEEYILLKLKSENRVIRNLAGKLQKEMLKSQFRFGKESFFKGDTAFKPTISLNKNKVSIEKLLLKEIITAIEDEQDKSYEKDIDYDGKKEIIIINSGNMYIFNQFKSGNILYWIDLTTGNKIVNNNEFITEHFLSEDGKSLFTFENADIITTVDSNGIKFSRNNYEKSIKFLKDGFEEKYSSDGLVKKIDIKIITASGYIEKAGTVGDSSMINPDNIAKIEFFNQNAGITLEIYADKYLVQRNSKDSLNITIPDNRGTIEFKKKNN